MTQTSPPSSVSGSDIEHGVNLFSGRWDIYLNVMKCFMRHHLRTAMDLSAVEPREEGPCLENASQGTDMIGIHDDMRNVIRRFHEFCETIARH